MVKRRRFGNKLYVNNKANTKYVNRIMNIIKQLDIRIELKEKKDS